MSGTGTPALAIGPSETSVLADSAVAGSNSCTISGDASTTQRIISLAVDCSGASWFKLSETEDFGESLVNSTVRVNIDSVASDNTYADISVTYSGEGSGGTAEPFYVQPASKQVNVLAVRYVFEDGDGNIAGVPNYMGDTWLKRTVFGTTVGFDN